MEKFVNFVEAPQLVIDRIERLRNNTSCIVTAACVPITIRND